MIEYRKADLNQDFGSAWKYDVSPTIPTLKTAAYYQSSGNVTVPRGVMDETGNMVYETEEDEYFEEDIIPVAEHILQGITPTAAAWKSVVDSDLAYIKDVLYYRIYIRQRRSGKPIGWLYAPGFKVLETDKELGMVSYCRPVSHFDEEEHEHDQKMLQTLTESMFYPKKIADSIMHNFEMHEGGDVKDILISESMFVWKKEKKTTTVRNLPALLLKELGLEVDNG